LADQVMVPLYESAVIETVLAIRSVELI